MKSHNWMVVCLPTPYDHPKMVLEKNQSKTLPWTWLSFTPLDNSSQTSWCHHSLLPLHPLHRWSAIILDHKGSRTILMRWHLMRIVQDLARSEMEVPRKMMPGASCGPPLSTPQFPWEPRLTVCEPCTFKTQNHPSQPYTYMLLLPEAWI